MNVAEFYVTSKKVRPLRALHVDLANSKAEMAPGVPTRLPLSLPSPPPPLADIYREISTPLGISLLSSPRFVRSFLSGVGAVFSHPIDVCHDPVLGGRHGGRSEAF